MGSGEPERAKMAAKPPIFASRIKINLSFYLLRCSVILCESDLEGEVNT